MVVYYQVDYHSEKEKKKKQWATDIQNNMNESPE